MQQRRPDSPDPQAPVVVIGDALIDELRDGTSVTELVGGAALNVAVGVQRLGVAATLVAMVGDDEAGGHIRSYLHDYGVDLVATPSARGTARAVSTRVHGEPTYVFNEAARARSIRLDDPAARAAIAAAPFTVVSCFPFDDAAQVRALDEATRGRPLVVDPNPRAGMLHSAAAFVAGFERLASRCLLVKVGADDAALLYDGTVDALRARLWDAGAQAVLATDGAAGATLHTAAGVVTAPVAAAAGPVVDTMGAGDAVLAAVVAELAGASASTGPAADAAFWAQHAERILERAMAVAAATVRAHGALLRVPGAATMDLDRLGT